MRRFSFALTLTGLVGAPAGLACLSALAPATALAQISDSERAAARQLFSEGDKLQQDGKYEEALDKFQRAQKVFSAPTNLLRVAQCQAQLNKLVEAAETYRTLIRTPLPAASPPAFQAAVDQAKSELAALEPRVPTVKIDVTPNAPNMQVQLNGQPLNVALLGEPLPLDPGTHKIMVFAPGYASNEQTITIRERDKKSLSFTLKATGGVAYGAGGALPNPNDDQAGKGNAGQGDGQGQPPPPPPPPDQWQTARKPATSSILLGIRIGASLPTGNLYQDSTNTNVGAGDYLSAGPAFALEGGLRFARSFYIGVFAEGASYGKGSKIDSGADVTLTSGAFGILLAYISNPYGFGFYGEVGADYRAVSETAHNVAQAGGGFGDQTTALSGGELLLGAGVHILAAKTLRVIPKVEVGLGSFGKASICDSGGTCANSSNFTSASHAFFFFGVGGYYNIDLR